MNPLAERIHLDFRSGEPLYLQIARQVEGMVSNGELIVGSQLPTVRELATELRINFNTVARAYRLLDEERLISTQRGRGTYIWEEPTEAVMQKMRQKTLEEITRNYLKETTRLGFSRDEAASMLDQLLHSEAKESNESEEPETERNQ